MAVPATDQQKARAEELRAEARRLEQAREESFQRSDTDGFLSQWAHGLNAQLANLQARIEENGGVHSFPALLDDATGERVKARLVYVADRYSYGAKVAKWIVLDENDRAIHWVPAFKSGARSTLAKLGLREDREEAPAEATHVGSSAVSVTTVARRLDDGYPAGARTLTAIRKAGLS